MRLSWVFFDLGSTLTDESAFENYFLSKVYESLKKNIIDINRDIFNKTLEDVIKERRCGSGGYRNITREVVRSFTRNKTVLNKIMHNYRTQITPKYSEMQKLYPETAPVIKELKEKYHLGLIANQPRGARENLRKFGILNHFKVISLSDEVGYSKPDPRIFLHALKEARCTANKALMVGNRLDNDVAPAKSIGMATVKVRRGRMAPQEPLNKLEEPDFDISTLRELPILLASFT